MCILHDHVSKIEPKIKTDILKRWKNKLEKKIMSKFSLRPTVYGQCENVDNLLLWVTLFWGILWSVRTVNPCYWVPFCSFFCAFDSIYCLCTDAHYNISHNRVKLLLNKNKGYKSSCKNYSIVTFVYKHSWTIYWELERLSFSDTCTLLFTIAYASEINMYRGLPWLETGKVVIKVARKRLVR